MVAFSIFIIFPRAGFFRKDFRLEFILWLFVVAGLGAIDDWHSGGNMAAWIKAI